MLALSTMSAGFTAFFFVLALACFILAALSVGLWRLNLVALGLGFWMLVLAYNAIAAA